MPESLLGPEAEKAWEIITHCRKQESSTYKWASYTKYHSLLHQGEPHIKCFYLVEAPNGQHPSSQPIISPNWYVAQALNSTQKKLRDAAIFRELALICPPLIHRLCGTHLPSQLTLQCSVLCLFEKSFLVSRKAS